MDDDLDRLGLPFCDCDSGRAVTEPAFNAGLVSDCKELLEARDTLAGRASLNWSASIPMAQWEGVTLEGPPQRVTRLNLSGYRLAGTIPPELSYLPYLEILNLVGNQLTGEIPSELGKLANLRELELTNNLLEGAMPSGFGQPCKTEGA